MRLPTSSASARIMTAYRDPVLGTGMAWKPPPYRKPDYNILFAVYYVDGRAAYISISPKKLAGGEHVVPAIAREMQEKGEIPPARLRA